MNSNSNGHGRQGSPKGDSNRGQPGGGLGDSQNQNPGELGKEDWLENSHRSDDMGRTAASRSGQAGSQSGPGSDRTGQSGQGSFNQGSLGSQQADEEGGLGGQGLGSEQGGQSGGQGDRQGLGKAPGEAGEQARQVDDNQDELGHDINDSSEPSTNNGHRRR